MESVAGTLGSSTVVVPIRDDAPAFGGPHLQRHPHRTLQAHRDGGARGVT
ncbi:hypothetical protein SAMN04488000_105169 [Lentzea albida]|uniref:Uncharacterized protein n=1 Tax=Lentzea albida TaxID=65499 RepID=A0A1H9K4I9_9PSEU|nr:hypothetical protein SAMN04488000_105169 [Lentzea albida]